MGNFANPHEDLRIAMLKTELPSPWRLCHNGGKYHVCHSERSEESHRINNLENRDSSANASEWHCDTVSWRRGVLQHIVDLKSTLPILVLLPVIPAQAGIQGFLWKQESSFIYFWFPAFAGTKPGFPFSREWQSSCSIIQMLMAGLSLIPWGIGRPFRKVFTSPQGEGFRPSPKVTLNEVKAPKLSIGLKKGQFLTSD